MKAISAIVRFAKRIVEFIIMVCVASALMFAIIVQSVEVLTWQ